MFTNSKCNNSFVVREYLMLNEDFQNKETSEICVSSDSKHVVLLEGAYEYHNSKNQS